MMTLRSLLISIVSLVLLSTQIDGSRHRPVRQRRADVCPYPTMNPCNFISCENNGQCVQDLTTIDCYRCLCTPGFSGKICETSVPILPAGCAPGCQNGGFCNGNVCQCLAGYTGTFCEINYCLPNNPCQNGGRCVPNTGGYQCDCTGTGYTGTICTEIIVTDPCASNPCVNGGRCSSNGGQVSCQCFNGYSGQYCQFAPVPCVTTPCQNGGTCNVLSTSGSGCVCTEQYTGAYCDTLVISTHPCTTMGGNLCQNGGECLVDGADYACKCATGWTGRNCNIAGTIITCNPNPCVHGTCYPTGLPVGPAVVCDCDSRWSGKWCDMNMDASCYAGYCLSGGVCRMNGNVPYCECPASYTGERCQSYIGPVTPAVTRPIPFTTTTTNALMFCNANTCQNGGICVEDNGTYRCECQPSWSGPTCTIWGVTTTTTQPTVTPDGGACSPNPCMNGAYCFASGSSFRCVCLASFTGTLCETSQTTTPPLLTTPGVSMTCADQPCQNGGTCVTVGSSYSCFCGLNSDYTGKNCDTTTPMTPDECPLNCAPGRCIFSGFPARPYACLWNGIMRPIDGSTGATQS